MKKNVFVVAISLLMACHVCAAELWIGAADVSITPKQPVFLAGQFYERIARKVASPCTANVLALESRVEGKAAEQAILISVDVVSIPAQVQSDFRAYVAPRLVGFDTNKLFLAATHTHTAPSLKGKTSDHNDVMRPEDYFSFMYQQMADAVVKAWEGRQPGGVAWGLGHAVVGHNRRVVYANGKAVMYGKTDRSDFRHLEGWEDHAVDVLCFTDAEKRLIATALIVPCPAQTVESTSQVSADYWHHVREGLRGTYGDDLVVLGFCGPAGDLMPRTMLRKTAEARMEKLRKISRQQEVARRIVRAFDETWEVIREDVRMDVPLVHRVERFSVPSRKITEAEALDAGKQVVSFAAQKKAAKEQSKAYSNAESRMRWFQRTIDTYEAQQKADAFNQIEMHVLRVGGVAIATNPFELFQDYAMRIHGGRSKAPQTVLIQLASPSDLRNSYLPSERAVKGGGYSAIPQSTPVGPEGGQALVEKTLSVINELFK